MAELTLAEGDTLRVRGDGSRWVVVRVLGQDAVHALVDLHREGRPGEVHNGMVIKANVERVDRRQP